MLGFHAISDAAICGLPDYLTGRVTASATVSCALDIDEVPAAAAILVDPREAPVFAVELYPRPLAL